MKIRKYYFYNLVTNGWMDVCIFITGVEIDCVYIHLRACKLVILDQVKLQMKILFKPSNGLQQKRVYTSLGSSCPTWVHQSPWQSRDYTHYSRKNHWLSASIWCTHVRQEEPKLVYTLFCCKGNLDHNLIFPYRFEVHRRHRKIWWWEESEPQKVNLVIPPFKRCWNFVIPPSDSLVPPAVVNGVSWFSQHKFCQSNILDHTLSEAIGWKGCIHNGWILCMY